MFVPAIWTAPFFLHPMPVLQTINNHVLSHVLIIILLTLAGHEHYIKINIHRIWQSKSLATRQQRIINGKLQTIILETRDRRTTGRTVNLTHQAPSTKSVYHQSRFGITSLKHQQRQPTIFA